MRQENENISKQPVPQSTALPDAISWQNNRPATQRQQEKKTGDGVVVRNEGGGDGGGGDAHRSSNACHGDGGRGRKRRVRFLNQRSKIKDAVTVSL